MQKLHGHSGGQVVVGPKKKVFWVPDLGPVADNLGNNPDILGNNPDILGNDPDTSG